MRRFGSGSSLWLVLRRELLLGWRQKAGWLVSLMFSLTALASLGLGLEGIALSPRLAAALLWVLLFFASVTCLGRGFADEELAGTLLALRLYAPAQALLFGKMLYAFLSLLLLAALSVPLFLLFFGVTVDRPLLLLPTLFLGLLGIAVAGTLISALATGGGGRGGLFGILLFPIALPLFLPGIALVAQSFGEAGAGLSPLSYLGGMALYDALLLVAASLLFDSLWYED